MCGWGEDRLVAWKIEYECEYRFAEYEYDEGVVVQGRDGSFRIQMGAK